MPPFAKGAARSAGYFYPTLYQSHVVRFRLRLGGFLFALPFRKGW